MKKQIVSKVPIKMLYGVDEKGNLLIINPKSHFNILRKSESPKLDEVYIETDILNSTLEIEGQVDKIASIIEFGDILEGSINSILKEEIYQIKESINAIIDSMES